MWCKDYCGYDLHMTTKGEYSLAVFRGDVDEFLYQAVSITPKVQSDVSTSEDKDWVGIDDTIVCLQSASLHPSLVEGLNMWRTTHQPMDAAIEGVAATNPAGGNAARTVALLINGYFIPFTSRIESGREPCHTSAYDNYFLLHYSVSFASFQRASICASVISLSCRPCSLAFCST